MKISKNGIQTPDTVLQSRDTNVNIPFNKTIGHDDVHLSVSGYSDGQISNRILVSKLKIFTPPKNISCDFWPNCVYLEPNH